MSDIIEITNEMEKQKNKGKKMQRSGISYSESMRA